MTPSSTVLKVTDVKSESLQLKIENSPSPIQTQLPIGANPMKAETSPIAYVPVVCSSAEPVTSTPTESTSATAIWTPSGGFPSIPPDPTNSACMQHAARGLPPAYPFAAAQQNFYMNYAGYPSQSYYPGFDFSSYTTQAGVSPNAMAYGSSPAAAVTANSTSYAPYLFQTAA